MEGTVLDTAAGASHGVTFLALMAPFIAAAVAPFLARRLNHNASWVLALVPALIFIHFLSFAGDVADGAPVTGGYRWIPSFDVTYSWMLDGLSLTFALLISGIGTFIVLYSGGYLKGHPHLGRFYSFILMFMGSMLGLVVSDNFFMLFVYWELTSITSFLLIGFDHEREASRRAAVQALVVTGAGGLALLAGVQERIRANEAPPAATLDSTLGDLLARTGREAEAEAAFRREIEAFPHTEEAYVRLAILFAAQHRFEEIQPTLEAMVRARPTPATFELAARTMADLGNDEDAAAYRRRGRELSGRSGAAPGR